MIGIADKLRALDIIRWNMVPTQRQQSLAEHTFMVAMIAEQIANECGIGAGMVIHMALYHDLEEVMTGDIPAPTKRKLKEAGVNFGAGGPLNHLGYWSEGATPRDHAIVKCADYIADIIFLKRYGRTFYADLVLNKLTWRFMEYLDPAVVSDVVRTAALKTLALCGDDQMNLP